MALKYYSLFESLKYYNIDTEIIKNLPNNNPYVLIEGCIEIGKERKLEYLQGYISQKEIRISLEDLMNIKNPKIVLKEDKLKKLEKFVIRRKRSGLEFSVDNK